MLGTLLLSVGLSWAAPQGYNYQRPSDSGAVTPGTIVSSQEPSGAGEYTPAEGVGGGVEPSGDAKYTFQWDVDDPSSGNFYGHAEARDGEVTEGR